MMIVDVRVPLTGAFVLCFLFYFWRMLCSLSTTHLQRHCYGCWSGLHSFPGTPRWSAQINDVRCIVLRYLFATLSTHAVACIPAGSAQHVYKTLCNAFRNMCGNSKACIQHCSKQRTAFPTEGLHAQCEVLFLAKAFPPRVCIF